MAGRDTTTSCPSWSLLQAGTTQQPACPSLPLLTSPPTGSADGHDAGPGLLGVSGGCRSLLISIPPSQG